jgi:uncharacterized RDD family membrane protein YckC
VRDFPSSSTGSLRYSREQEQLMSEHLHEAVAAPVIYCPACGSHVAEGQPSCSSCGRRMVIDLRDGPPAVPMQRDENGSAAPPAPAIPFQGLWPAAGEPPARPGQEPMWIGQQAAPPLQQPMQPPVDVPQMVDYPPQVEPPRPPAGETPLLPHRWVPASFGQRVGARLIDGIVVALLSGLLYLGVGGLVSALGITRVGVGFLLGALLLLILLPSVISAVYRIGSDFGFGRSLGRAAVGIRLVKLPGGAAADTAIQPADQVAHVGIGTTLGRVVVSGFGDCLFFLNSLSVLWDGQRRSWGDHAANTVVVVDTNGEKRSAWTPPAVAAALCAALCFGLVLVAPTKPVAGVPISDNVVPGGTFEVPSFSPAPVPSYTAPPAARTAAPGTDGGISTSEPNPQANTYPTKSDIWVRTGPSTSDSEVKLVTAGTPVTVVCQKEGEQIPGPSGASDLWDQIDSPASGWVSDEFVATGTAGTNHTVAPPCS